MFFGPSPWRLGSSQARDGSSVTHGGSHPGMRDHGMFYPPFRRDPQPLARSPRSPAADMATTTLSSRRWFVTTSGMVAAVFVLPGYNEEGSPASSNPVNDAWEARAMELEATGQGIYTADDELDLPGKGETHLPRVAVSGKTVTASTTHVMSVEADHFIQCHSVRDQAEVIFALREYVLGEDLAATMTFAIPEGTTKFTVYQYCNLHWTWMAAEQTAST